MLTLKAIRCVFLHHNVIFPVRSYSAANISCMHGWQALEYGNPDVLQLNTTLKFPYIKRPTDVMVEIHAASINPIDVMMLNSYGSTMISVMRNLDNCSLNTAALPMILGRDFSGVVVSTGSCVKSVRPGDEVVGVVEPQNQGSHADFVTTSAFYVTKKPAAVTHVEAASIPYAALTAFSALSTFGGLSRNSAQGKRVLVLGASGGVGTMAVQLLKAWGANVTATCATDAMELLMNLGVDNAIDYLSPDHVQEMKIQPRFDFILDCVGGEGRILAAGLLKSWQNCKYVTVVSPLLRNADQYGFVFGNVKSAIEASMDTLSGLKNGQSVRWAYFIPNRCALKTILQMVADRQIVPVIESVFRFDNAPDGYKKVLQGHARGKTVIDFKTLKEESSEESSEQNKTEHQAVKL